METPRRNRDGSRPLGHLTSRDAFCAQRLINTNYFVAMEPSKLTVLFWATLWLQTSLIRRLGRDEEIREEGIAHHVTATSKILSSN